MIASEVVPKHQDDSNVLLQVEVFTCLAVCIEPG